MKYILAFCVLLNWSIGFTQEKSTIEESLTYFKDGVVFEHKPTHFKNKFRFRIQNRFSYETEEAQKLAAETVDFTVRRMRMRFEGHVLDPRFLYKIQLSFTRGDMDWDRTEYPNILRDAAVGWKLTEFTTFWYGQTKLPGNRQRVISSNDQQFVDRSLVNATFNIDRDLGAQVYHKIGSERPFWIKLAISNGDGRATDNNDNGLAYTSRIEWLPFGEFIEDGDYFESDHKREPKPKLSVGAVYSMNKKATRAGGQIGRQFQTPGLNRDIETSFLDAIFKYRGFSWQAEYAKRWTDDPFFSDGSNSVTIFKGEGFTTQAAYLYDNNFEHAVRFSRIQGEKETLSGENNQNQYTLAASKYLNSHRVKIQTDLTYAELDNHMKDTYSSNWIYRLQLEIGI